MKGRLRDLGFESIPAIVGFLVALVLGEVLIAASGKSSREVYWALLDGTWGNRYGVGQVLYKATTLAFTGYAVAIGLRAGLFNIGAESQLAGGAFAAGLVGLVLPAGMTGWVAVPICILAAAAGGGAVGAVPGVLKARYGAHEVIVTIMLNFIVLGILNWIVAAKLHDRETLHTPAMHAGTVPRLSTWFASLHGSAVNGILCAAVLAAVVLAVLLFYSPFGYEVRAVGFSPDAAAALGISVHGTWIKALTLGGALAGIGGANFVLGYKGYYEDGLAGGAGFMGIAVALVGRNHPMGILFAALLFGTLSQGGLAIHAMVPKQLVEVLQAVVILAIVAAAPEVRRLLARARAGAAS